MANNFPEFADMFEALKKEGGFVGLKSYEENPFGNATKDFHDMQEDAEEMERKVMTIQDDMKLEQEETTRHIDCL